jgi:hypothetical protein
MSREMSFSLFFAFPNERDVKMGVEKLQILLPVFYKDISGINYKNLGTGVCFKERFTGNRKIN